jgi:carboxylesterase
MLPSTDQQHGSEYRMSETQVQKGAEAWSAEGGANGALVLHGFTGNPSSMRGIAEAFANAGYSVELPRLPGHGTTVEDMLTTGWDDWTAEVEAAYQRLAARCEKVVVCGLSMGGALTVWTALEHPEVVGVVCINPAAKPDEGLRGLVQVMLDGGDETMPGIGSDIADPDAEESAYELLPLRPLLTMLDSGAAMAERLGDGRCPMLLCSSPQDHVVPPENSDFLAEQWGGPVERVTLERSFHVATLDFDKDLIIERTLAFAGGVTA